MKADTPNIQGVFNYSTILRIPFFQRQYVWTEENWERFANDMEALVDLSNNKKYFLGALIFKEEIPTDQEAAYGVSKKYTVIDGQQRLTTLSIYLRALYSFLIDDQLKNNFNSAFYIQDSLKTPVLYHSATDRPAYQVIMNHDNENELAPYKERNVVKAYSFFKERNDGRGSDEIRKLWMAIFAHINFVSINLQSEDDEQQIFDTINSLGVSLTVDELMKNFLYDADKEDEYNRNWKPVFDENNASKFWKQHDAAKSQAETDLNKVSTNFFYDFVRIKMWEYKDKPGFDRGAFVQKNQVFSTCKAFHDIFHADKQDLANEIIAYAKLYKQYFDKENLRKRLPMYPSIERVACIAMVKDSTVIPYLLYVLKNVPDEQEQNKIFDFLEKYLVRRMICFPSSKSKMGNEFYTEQLIAKEINTCQKLSQYIMSIAPDKNMHMPDDQEVQMFVHDMEFGDEETPRLIYYLHETKLSSQQTGGWKTFYAVPLMPKPAKANEKNYPPHTDDQKEKLRKKRTRTIGNFLLLETPYDPNDNQTNDYKWSQTDKNLKKIANDAFASKSTAIKNLLTTTNRCSDWFRNQNSWTEADIDDRNRNYANGVINRLWKI